MTTKLETLAGDGATFDTLPSSALYRYRLWRTIADNVVTEPVLFVMLNPSTAVHDVPDPTITRCVGFAKRLGAGRLEVVNLFAFRATNPEQLGSFIGDVVGPENDEEIARAAKQARIVVCAWGAKIPKRPSANGRVSRVLELLREAGHPTVYCLGETKAGHPRHPLYLAANTPLEVYAG
jgi:hypothetical protein